MSIEQYQLSWDSYKSSVCNGFTNLQQNEEFVDMTLVADGHLVKVHKSMFALASPYIKSMLKCTPNEHPIIFLSSVSHDILNYILTYVYTGEVSVEANKIHSFMRVAKDLRLSGLFGMPSPKVTSNKSMEENNTDRITQRRLDNTMPVPDTENPVSEMVTDNIEILDTNTSEQVYESNMESDSNMISPLSSDINVHNDTVTNDVEETQNNRNGGLFTTADGYQYKLEIPPAHKIHPDNTPVIIEDTHNEPSEMMQSSDSMNNDNTANNHSNNIGAVREEFEKTMNAASKVISLQPEAITLQFTMSSRHSLQLILNRYMYCCHHQSCGGRKRRWRCIDYRSKHCPAFIDTDGEIMTSRKFGHNHSFHDEKIRLKMKKDMVYTNLNVLLQKQSNKN